MQGRRLRFLEAIFRHPARLFDGVDVVSGTFSAVTRRKRRVLAAVEQSIWRADEGSGR